MKESIHKYFQVGTITWMSFPKLSHVEATEKVCKDDFFDAVEVCKQNSKEDADKIKEMCAEAHMKVCYGAQPRILGPKLNPNAMDEAERQKAEATLIEAVDEAEYYGAKGIAFIAGKWEEENKEEEYKQLLKTTINVCKYAATKNMNVELEVFDYDVDKAVLIGPAPLAKKFAADVRRKCDNFGLLVDLSHIPITFETPSFAVGEMRDFITHFHIGNAVVKEGCEAYGDMHPRFGYPNSANDVEQLAEFFRVLKRDGFFNAQKPYVLSIEVKPWKDEDADLILAGTKRVINRAWAMVED